MLLGVAGAVVVAAAAASTSSTTRRIDVIRFHDYDPPAVMQQDITVFARRNNTSEATMPLECAALAYVDGHLLILSDRHDHVVFTAKLDLKTLKVTTPKPQTLIGNEQYLMDDAEAMTIVPHADGGFTGYIMGSLSNDKDEQPEPKRRHFLRWRFKDGATLTPTENVVINASPLREQLNGYFEQAGIEPYRTFNAGFTGEDKNTYRWANVEGITFTPDGEHLLCGMRNPLVEGKALLFTVSERHVRLAFDHEDAEALHVSDLFALDLGHRGVSDLCWDPQTRGYLIAAARSNGPKLNKDQSFPPNSLDSALFWWSGNKSDKPVQFAAVPGMKIEAICRLGETRFIAIGSDERDESESREDGQSVLTIMDFTGIPGAARVLKVE